MLFKHPNKRQFSLDSVNLDSPLLRKPNEILCEYPTVFPEIRSGYYCETATWNPENQPHTHLKSNVFLRSDQSRNSTEGTLEALPVNTQIYVVDIPETRCKHFRKHNSRIPKNSLNTQLEPLNMPQGPAYPVCV